MGALLHPVEHGMVLRERPAASPRGTLLLVHGLGESGLCFEGLFEAPALADWHLLVPDLPGYGRSPWPPEPLGLAGHADHLAAWLESRGAPPVVVVGHSLGGVIALLLTERHPARVRALVDVDGNKSAADCTFSGQVAGQPLAEFRAGGFDRLRAAVHEAGRDDPAQRGYHVSLRLADPATFHRDSRELYDLSVGETLAARLAALPQPHRYVAGGPGGASPRSLELLRAAGVPFDVVAPSGHWPFIDQPAGFLAVLRAFLDRL